MNTTIETRKQQIAFPIVANIRKGGPKGERRPGRDLEQKFRVVFEPVWSSTRSGSLSFTAL